MKNEGKYFMASPFEWKAVENFWDTFQWSFKVCWKDFWEIIKIFVTNLWLQREDDKKHEHRGDHGKPQHGGDHQ